MAITSPTIPLGTGIKVMTFVLQTNYNNGANRLIPLSSGNSNIILNEIADFMQDLVKGVWSSNIQVIQGGVYAKVTATLASVVATNTIVIGGVTLTCVNSGASSVQFNKGTTDTLTAVNLAAAINALTTINKVVGATSSGAVVTIYSLYPGTIGNLITTTATGGTITVAAAMTGGTDGTKGDISHGL